MTGREWIDEYARRMETRAPTEDEWQELLKLASEAAHSSERLAAPIACWLAAHSGRPLIEAVTIAGEIVPEAQRKAG